MRQTWNDGAFHDMINDPTVGREGVVQLLTKSLAQRVNNPEVLSDTAARDFAEAILETKLTAMARPQVDAHALRSDNLSASMASIDEIIRVMNRKNRQSSIEQVTQWLKTDDIGAAGYTNKRYINLDYAAKVNVNGRTVSIMDLLDNDVIGGINRYAKEAAGRSAISKASGFRLNGETAIDDFINAMGMQAADLGTYVNTKDARNLFRQMMGLPFDNQLPIDVRKIRDAISLAGMNGLGESQLAEFGLAANRGMSGLFALNQLANKHIGNVKEWTNNLQQWRHFQITDKQKASASYLKELQEFSKMYDESHIMARNNVHFDTREPQMAQGAMSKLIDFGTGGKYRPVLQYLQTRYTYYSAVRVMEEQVAMAGLMQDAMKFIRTGKGDAVGATTKARFADVGLDLTLLKRKVNQRIIELNEDGTVRTLNMHRWSKDEQLALGVALQRHAGQQVQRAFAGEMSPLMTNPMVAMMMQFRTYPVLAAEKQMGRNAMFADKEAAMGIALNGASSSIARMVRYYSLSLALPEEKRERYLDNRMANDFGHDSLAYMGIVGMMVQNYDLVDDLALGNGSPSDQLPALNWADNYLKMVKAANPDGQLTERDLSNMQRGAPIGTIAQVNAIAGVIKGLIETDDQTARPRRNLQRN